MHAVSISSMKMGDEDFQEEEWYYHLDGKRERYKHCGSCHYKTRFMKSLALHKEKGCRPPVKRPYFCDLCGFRSNTKYSLENHIKKHEHKSAHQCQLCSFSASALGALTRHQNHDHGRKTKNAEVTNIFTIIIFAFFLREIYIASRNLSSLSRVRLQDSLFDALP